MKHRAAHLILRGAGYRWESRRSGELELGLWRKTFREAKPRARRFVLVPGLGDSPISWLGVLTLLLPVFRSRFDEVVLLDFPGFGGALSHQKCISSLDLLLDRMTGILDELKPEAVMGHSLGGWLSADYATRAGGREKGYRGPTTLILASPSGLFGGKGERMRFEARFRKAVREGFLPLREALFAREPFWFRFVAGEFSRFIQRQDTVDFLLSIREEHSLEKQISKIHGSLWLVWGEKDTLVPSHWAKYWLKGLEGTEVTVRALYLNEVGHSPQLEAPGLLALLVSKILRNEEPRPAREKWWRELGRTV